MLTVIRSFEDLMSIELDLNAFYKSFKEYYFLSPGYCIKAYELFYNVNDTNSIYFIIKRVDDKIVGYIPLYINTKGILKFIHQKHTDFLSEVGSQFNFNDYKNITQKIEKNSLIKKIDLDNLHSESKMLHFFKHFFMGRCSVYSYNNHSFLKTKEKGGMLIHLSSSDRSELRRIHKKTKFIFKIFTHTEIFPRNKIESLIVKMISNGSRENNFLESNTLNFIEYLFEKGEVEIFTKTINSQFVSASVVLKNKVGKRMVWIDLYDDIPYINLGSYIEYINYLNENGIKYLNFGRGSYDYKAKNFKPNCENLFNFRYSKSKWDFFFTNYYPIKEFAKRFLKAKK